MTRDTTTRPSASPKAKVSRAPASSAPVLDRPVPSLPASSQALHEGLTAQRVSFSLAAVKQRLTKPSR